MGKPQRRRPRTGAASRPSRSVRAGARARAIPPLLDAVFDGAGVGLCLLDGSDRIRRVNPEWLASTGFRAEEVVGEPIWKLVPLPAEEIAGLVALNARVRAGATCPLPAVRLKVNGRERWFEGRASPVALEDGPGVLVTSVDITGLKRSEEAVREREERLRLTLEATDAGIWDWDVRTNAIVWSDGVLRLYGLGPGVAPSYEAWRSAVHPEDLERVERVVQEAAAAGSPLEVDWRPRLPAGETRWLTSRATPVRDPDGAVSRFIGIVLDSTAHRRAEEVQRRLEGQLQRAQKLESVGRLAGGVAHDFNNLLTVILSCAESLGEAAADGRRVDGTEIDEIRTAGHRARDLTRQLLAFARKQLIAPVALDLGAVVREGENLLRRVLGEQIELEVRVAPELWSVCCDPGQMEQVIVNLAVNARDAMPRGGRLTLALENAVLVPGEGPFSGAAPGDHVRLRVRDTGVGMSPEVMSHLFEPFFTTKPRGSGTGLGLATSYGIVRQSGGGIHVESAPDRGSTFDVYLPRSTLSPAPLRPPRPSSAGGTEEILVVEDDALVREVTVRALRAGGYRVTVAEHPQRALELPAAQLAATRLLVTDVVMPGLDGRSLADALLRRHATLRVLFVSGYTQDALAARGVVDSGVEFLPKPFTPAALLSRVREVLDAPRPAAG